MKDAGSEGRKPFALALVAALLAGMAAAGLLREKEGVLHQKPPLDAGAERLGGADGGRFEGEVVELPDLVSQVLRTDAKGSNAEDRRIVWDFLRETCSERGRSIGANWLEVDEALTWLRSASSADPEIERALLEIASDDTLLEPLRCFALHHLGALVDARHVEFSTVARLRALVEASGGGAAGSAALRVLNSLSSSPSEAEWLRRQILQLVDESAAGPAERRVVALQIAVELGASEVEPHARRLVSAERQQAERVAAFHALAQLGTRETLRWIHSQPEPFELLVKDARQIAISRLADR